MKIIFISNYYTHHQAPLCRALYELTDGQFLFLETEAFSRERQSMGWQARPACRLSAGADSGAGRMPRRRCSPRMW